MPQTAELVLNFVKERTTILENANATRLDQKITFECVGCGKPTSRVLRYCKTGSYGLYCSKCIHMSSAKSRANTVDAVAEFIKSKGCTLSSKEYSSSHEKLNIICSCGNTYSQTLSDFRSISRNGRPNQCPSCSSKVKIQQQTYTLDDVVLKIKDTGCEYISGDYTSHNDKLVIKCRRCGELFTNTWKDFQNNGTHACKQCTGRSTSEAELEIQQYLSELGLTFSINDRSVMDNKKEIDIVINNPPICIEYNGVHYHSEQFGRDKNYHLDKTLRCQELQFQLLHIWDCEWKDRILNKKDIWKSIIAAKTNKIDKSNRIYARQCTVVELDHSTSSDFLNSNHLQGGDKSSIRLGLLFGTELVQVMTFSKPRFNKQFDYEMVRNSAKKFHIVVGGSSKLLTWFKRHYNPISIITYADLRYSQGDVYKQLGFSCLHRSKPSYFYTKRNKLYNRMQFQKHKLKKKLEVYDDSKSEHENMKLNNFYRIWDCGCLVFVWFCMLPL